LIRSLFFVCLIAAFYLCGLKHFNFPDGGLHPSYGMKI
jgi:hypothetical protein